MTEQIENILKPFTQADDSIGTFGGSGLGISIVNRLIGQMDGTFDITSEPQALRCRYIFPLWHRKP